MSAPLRVLIADPINEAGLELLRADERLRLAHPAGEDEAALARDLARADAAIVRGATRVTSAALRRADRLRVIGRAGAGVDNIDLEAASERGVAVFNAPAGNAVSAAELTFALTLALARHLPAADRSLRAGEWRRAAFRGIELSGKALGLIGAGRVGGEVARRARAFGMRVVACDPALGEERAAELGVERAGFEQVLERADVVSLHVPLDAETEGLIDASALERMKPSALLVNMARGGVVDEDALTRALEEGRLAGAALDVYETEPLPGDHPLRRMDNVVLTPHIGAMTDAAKRKVAVEIVEAVRAALFEGDVSGAVNADALRSAGR